MLVKMSVNIRSMRQCGGKIVIVPNLALEPNKQQQAGAGNAPWAAARPLDI